MDSAAPQVMLLVLLLATWPSLPPCPVGLTGFLFLSAHPTMTGKNIFVAGSVRYRYFILLFTRTKPLTLRPAEDPFPRSLVLLLH